MNKEVIRVEDQWYVLATSSRADERTRVLKDGETFGVFDRFGDAHQVGQGEQGLYHEGTRHLSRFEVSLNGHRPLLLNSSVCEDNTLLVVDLTAPDLYENDDIVIRKDTLHLFRSKLLWRGVCYEHYRIANFGDDQVNVCLDFEYGADYSDIFEVRGLKRKQRGTAIPAEIESQGVVLGYRGLDDIERRTRLHFSPPPSDINDHHARIPVKLEPGESLDLYVTVSCIVGDEIPTVVSYNEALTRANHGLKSTRAKISSLYSSNEQFNDWVNRSEADLLMLTSTTPFGLYPYAGVPWFSTPFGRDGIITAFQFLWIYPEVARGVLNYLAARQAEAIVPEQDAEPGKIMHETRRGELAALGEVPFGLYYGSVDSTPLFVMLAGAYYDRTGDRSFIETIWPNILRALEWIDTYGDTDGDGFVEYSRKAETGLFQQGWKDSSDSVFHADGTPAEPPIALCEVQGYVYAARLAAARLGRLFGDNPRSDELEKQAASLKTKFNEAFWCEEIGTYAIALDGEKKPCKIRSSNAGHVLFSGIATQDYADRVAETLLSDASFSGWGIRTVASRERRYNPMSYHNGSIWPHDNGIVAMGLARYGHKDKAMKILTGLFDASIAMDSHRLPELFCGFNRLPGQGPTLYPVACSPQAWASGAVFHLLQACLGISFSAEKPQLRFDNPQLPEYLWWVKVHNLRIGSAVVDLELTRHTNHVGVHVMNKSDEVDIAVYV